MLTGKYDPDAAAAAEGTPRRPPGHAHDADRVAAGIAAHRAGRSGDHAEARGVTAGQFALAWVLNNRSRHRGRSPARAPRRNGTDYLGALDYAFTADDEALVDRLVATGHPSTPGYNDPAYPIEGRLPR